MSWNEVGLDQVESYRLRAWGKPPCRRWVEHEWFRFIHASHPGYTFVVLCGNCGRDPAEALAALPVVVPVPIPANAREVIANYLMDARVDGPYWKPPSKLTYQEAMRKYADEILRELGRG